MLNRKQNITNAHVKILKNVKARKKDQEKEEDKEEEAVDDDDDDDDKIKKTNKWGKNRMW